MRFTTLKPNLPHNLLFTISNFSTLDFILLLRPFFFIFSKTDILLLLLDSVVHLKPCRRCVSKSVSIIYTSKVSKTFDFSSVLLFHQFFPSHLSVRLFLTCRTPSLSHIAIVTKGRRHRSAFHHYTSNHYLEVLQVHLQSLHFFYLFIF